MRNHELDQIFKLQAISIKVFMKVSVVEDPIEKNTTDTILNSLPIKAIVSDLVASQITYKLPGITTEEAKEIIVQKKHRSLIELSEKIEIDGKTYMGWETNSRLQIRSEQNYIRCYIYIKKDG